MPAPGLPTPLARLYSTAVQLGIIVLDALDDHGIWPDDDTAAIVGCGKCIAINPGLETMACAPTCSPWPWQSRGS
jgi:hypothetical protein